MRMLLPFQLAGLGVITACTGSPITTDPLPTLPPGAPYPIVLAHGAFGFDQIGPIDYFYGVAQTLRDRGRTVITPRVDALQSTEVRGPELASAVDDLRARTGADKVVIIAHSQGGLDARWVADADPDHVAAVITISTPHHGTQLADVAAGLMPGDSASVMSALVDLFGVATDGSQSSIDGTLESMTSPGIAAFNAAHPDAPGVAYYSIAGRSNLAGADACPTTTPFLARWNDQRDTMAPEVSPLAGMLAAAILPDRLANDGLVTVESSRWGEFLGCIPADHLDEICQIAGSPSGIGNDFDCLEFWGGLEQFVSDTGF